MGAQQLLDRVWAVLMSESADEIKRTLRSFVDDKDRILVAEVGHDWASRRALFRLGELIEFHMAPLGPQQRMKMGSGAAG